MHQHELSRFRALLEEKREQLRGLRDSLEDWSLGQSAQQAVDELSKYDNHPGDIGSELFFRSQDIAFKGEEEANLEAVNRALERIDDGTYGYCLRCGQAIARERLEALPEAELCIDCKQAVEREEQPDPEPRPVEEDVLAPPFGRSFNDATDDVGFDGEDTWQAVVRYGTSETPSDVPPEKPANIQYPYVYINVTDEDNGIVEPIEGMVAEDGEVLPRTAYRPDAPPHFYDDEDEEEIRPGQ